MEYAVKQPYVECSYLDNCLEERLTEPAAEET
jgi:hypothetical protein